MQKKEDAQWRKNLKSSMQLSSGARHENRLRWPRERGKVVTRGGSEELNDSFAEAKGESRYLNDAREGTDGLKTRSGAGVPMILNLFRGVEKDLNKYF